MQTTRSIAIFVTPHGLGHAARTAAIMAAMRKREPGLRFELFTGVPLSFFRQSVETNLGYHQFDLDIGLVQDAPLHADVSATIDRLDNFLPFDSQLTRKLAESVKALGCDLIVCDIAPIGIAVAQLAGVPSVLVENFTWDWIYEDYTTYRSQLDHHIEYLRMMFENADYHVQTEPVSRSGRADIVTDPVSRRIREAPQRVRHELNLPLDKKVVLVTMGGIPDDCNFIHMLEERDSVHFVVPSRGEAESKPQNVHYLPHNAGFYHPDVVNACDCVIGKLGYSTASEIYQAGLPYGFVMRPHFREAEVLASFVKKHMATVGFEPSEFEAGTWLEHLDELLKMPRDTSTRENGDAQAAAFILDLPVSS